MGDYDSLTFITPKSGRGHAAINDALDPLYLV